jgi:hypothetical protein
MMKIQLVMIMPYDGYHVYFMYGAEWYILITKENDNSRLSDYKKAFKLKALRTRFLSSQVVTH